MKEIKVLQVNKLYYPVIGGIENLVREIAEGINRMDVGIRVDVLVCQEKGPYEELEINGVKVMRAPSFGVRHSLPISPAFVSIFRRICHSYDIIHFHMPFPIGDLALLLSGYKGKVVVWWHSDIIRQKKSLAIYKPILMQFLKRVDVIIAATPNHISSSKFINSFSSKCIIIPIGIEVDQFINTSQSVLKQISENLQMLNSRQSVLFVGRLVYYKGIDILIRAMVNNDALLIIVGDGPLKETLMDLATHLGIHDRIHFLGHLSNDQMIAWYHSCTLFAFPSVANSEAYGLVQLEAMACGKPVINTNLPTGVPCVSLHEQTGLTVPVNDVEALSDAIHTLLSDQKMRDQFGRNAKDRALSLFTSQIMLERIKDFYNSLLQK